MSDGRTRCCGTVIETWCKLKFIYLFLKHTGMGRYIPYTVGSTSDLLFSARITPLPSNTISFLDSHIGSMMQNTPLMPTQILKVIISLIHIPSKVLLTSCMRPRT